MSRINNMPCQWLFILYFLTIAIFPYSHDHADSAPFTVYSNSAGYSLADHGLCVSDGLHGEHYTEGQTFPDNRHFHFLGEDTNPSSRPPFIEKAAPLRDIAISETATGHFSKHSAVAMFADRIRPYSDACHSPFSGLSPPSC